MFNILRAIRVAPYRRCSVGPRGQMCGTCLGSAKRGLSAEDFRYLVSTHEPARRAADFFSVAVSG